MSTQTFSPVTIKSEWKPISSNDLWKDSLFQVPVFDSGKWWHQNKHIEEEKAIEIIEHCKNIVNYSGSEYGDGYRLNALGNHLKEVRWEKNIVTATFETNCYGYPVTATITEFKYRKHLIYGVEACCWFDRQVWDKTLRCNMRGSLITEHPVWGRSSLVLYGYGLTGRNPVLPELFITFKY